MSTYNRGGLLEGAVRSLLNQDMETPPFELLVVDNNSSDRTREVVERVMAGDPRVRYLLEGRQGLSYARNAGIAAARAPIVAFTDDDVRAPGGWVAAVLRAFAEHPEADAVGGRVLPMWPAPPPAWLTADHWAPLALVDHGNAPVAVTRERLICLVGANLAVRREVFDVVGGFDPECQRVRDGIGSLEDHEFLLRLVGSGRTGVYDPRIVLHAAVQPDRLGRPYHRRWHAGHGAFHARLRSAEMERTDVGTWSGVPAHLYRQALGDAAGWLRAAVAGDAARAFHHEVRLRFFAGFYATRRREFRARPRRERRAELRRLLHGSVARPVALLRRTAAGAARSRG